MNLSLDDKISALFLCADILSYPEEGYKEKVDKLLTFSGENKKTDKYSLEDIQAEFLRIFNIQSSALKCVPYASWWLDGKMSGTSIARIIGFYNSCGYEFDSDNEKIPADHISYMFSFIALLAEEKKFDKIKDFAKFLTWMDDLEKSLSLATEREDFQYAVNLAIKIINSLKENT